MPKKRTRKLRRFLDSKYIKKIELRLSLLKGVLVQPDMFKRKCYVLPVILLRDSLADSETTLTAEHNATNIRITMNFIFKALDQGIFFSFVAL